MELSNKSSQILDYEQSDECIGFKITWVIPFFEQYYCKT